MSSDLGALKQSLDRVKAVYHRQRGEELKLLQDKEAREKRLVEVRDSVECLERVRLLLQEAASHAREQGRRQVEFMVTQALQFVFGGDLDFKVVIEDKRDRPEAEFYVCSNYGGDLRVETAPQDARGGGVVDVISLALRLALLPAGGRPGDPGRTGQARFRGVLAPGGPVFEELQPEPRTPGDHGIPQPAPGRLRRCCLPGGDVPGAKQRAARPLNKWAPDGIR